MKSYFAHLAGILVDLLLPATMRPDELLYLAAVHHVNAPNQAVPPTHLYLLDARPQHSSVVDAYVDMHLQRKGINPVEVVVV